MRSSRGVVCILAVAALAGALGCSGSGQQASDTAAATETEGSAPIGDPPSVQERKASDRIALELYDARGRRVGWVDFWQLREGGVTLFEVAPREIWSAPLLLRAGTCRKNVARTWSRLDGWNESPWTPAELRGSTWAIDLHGGKPGVVTACGSHNGDRLLPMRTMAADQGERRRRNGRIVVTGGKGKVELRPDAAGTAVDIEFSSGSSDILGHVRRGACGEPTATVPYAFTLTPVENEFAEGSLVLPIAFERFATDSFALELEGGETCLGLGPVP